MNGYICTKVELESIYSRMGIQKGDVVVEIDGKSMAPPEAGMDNWREFDRAETATVLIERAGRQIKLKKPNPQKS
jgi:type II secretory pathway component PulC